MEMADQPVNIDGRSKALQELSRLIPALPCVSRFVEDLNQALSTGKSSACLSTGQRLWLSTVLMGIVVTGTLNWAAFERRRLQAFKQSRRRWMFGSAKIAWPLLLQASVGLRLRHYGVTRATRVIDDTEKPRSKKTTKIAGTHTVKDKKSGGYFNGQELIFLVLVTELITLPVGFRWYRPDPALKAWCKQDERLKRKGIPRSQRPDQPAPNPDYPTKQALAPALVEEFTGRLPELRVKAPLADALYGTGDFMDGVGAATANAPVVSQRRSNQRVYSRGRKVALSTYFARQAGVPTQLTVRGGEKKRVTLLAARRQVKAHGKRRFVIALKYEGETDYRFLVASDLSWRHQDIAVLYTLRWLVEVFIADWKQQAGWNRLTKHQGPEGSTRGVILSLLCDHLLRRHPEQSARLENKQPGLSAGCLIESLKAEALVVTIEGIVRAEQPEATLEAFIVARRDTLPQRSSSKHMAGRDLGRMEATPSRRYYASDSTRVATQSQQ